MEEAFLHFIWKFQQFNSRELKTDSGQVITVLHPGFKNSDAGPDFNGAKVRIGEITWNGNVEIHVHAKDWNRHNHQHDKAYDNVILHVVWKNDTTVLREDNTTIPAFELQHVVDEKLINKYHQLFEPGYDILCSRFLDHVKSITRYSMMDKALAQRLEEKSAKIFREIAFTGNDWEEIAWRMLCQNFGFKTNAFPFFELGKSLPLKVVKKESENLKTVEALLFGQAGFLEEDLEDEYFMELKREYNFKRTKYSLERNLDKHQWKFLRMRPANFPTIRIAQLAALITQQSNLFSFFMDYTSISDLKKNLEVVQSNYWINHYNFGSPAKTQSGKLGISSIENILINTVAPLLFAYGVHKDQRELKEKSMELLASIKPEINSITKKWIENGIGVKSAFDSQALIEIYNAYCLKKRCLNCAIGTEIIRGK